MWLRDFSSLVLKISKEADCIASGQPAPLWAVPMGKNSFPLCPSEVLFSTFTHCFSCGRLVLAFPTWKVIGRRRLLWSSTKAPRLQTEPAPILRLSLQSRWSSSPSILVGVCWASLILALSFLNWRPQIRGHNIYMWSKLCGIGGIIISLLEAVLLFLQLWILLAISAGSSVHSGSSAAHCLQFWQHLQNCCPDWQWSVPYTE